MSTFQMHEFIDWIPNRESLYVSVMALPLHGSPSPQVSHVGFPIILSPVARLCRKTSKAGSFQNNLMIYPVLFFCRFNLLFHGCWLLTEDNLHIRLSYGPRVLNLPFTSRMSPIDLHHVNIHASDYGIRPLLENYD